MCIRDREEAAKFAGGAVTLLIGGGIVLCILTLLFLEPLMWGCGATADTIDYALTYTCLLYTSRLSPA